MKQRTRKVMRLRGHHCLVLLSLLSGPLLLEGNPPYTAPSLTPAGRALKDMLASVPGIRYDTSSVGTSAVRAWKSCISSEEYELAVFEVYDAYEDWDGYGGAYVQGTNSDTREQLLLSNAECLGRGFLRRSSGPDLESNLRYAFETLRSCAERNVMTRDLLREASISTNSLSLEHKAIAHAVLERTPIFTHRCREIAKRESDGTFSHSNAWGRITVSYTRTLDWAPSTWADRGFVEVDATFTNGAAAYHAYRARLPVARGGTASERPIEALSQEEKQKDSQHYLADPE